MDENIALAREFVEKHLVAKGMIADLAIHAPDKVDGGISNPHFHIMTTMRPLNPDGTWGQKQRREYVLDEHGNRLQDEHGNYIFNAVPTTDWSRPETLEMWRQQWAEMVNKKFEEKGLDARIDHRSYKQQGIETIPTIHEGPVVRQIEAQGYVTDKGDLNRWIKATNQLVTDLKKRIKSLLELIGEIKEELSQPETPNLGELIGAYYETRNANAWSNKVKSRNLKEFAEVINYLTENNLLTVGALRERAALLSDTFDNLNSTMRTKSAQIKELEELLRYAEMYEECKPVYDQIQSIHWKKGKREAYENEHDADLRRYYTACRILKEQLGDQPVTTEEWKQKLSQLQQEYATLSSQFKSMRDEVTKLTKIEGIVDKVLTMEEQKRLAHRSEQIDGTNL